MIKIEKDLSSEYSSLEKIMGFLKTKTEYIVSIEPDEWITDGGLMLTPGKKCIVIKKNATTGAKVNVIESSKIEIHSVTPSSFMNRMVQKGLLAIIIYGIIEGGQKKVAEEVANYFEEIVKE